MATVGGKLPRPAPRQQPGPAFGLVLLGDPPSFNEDDPDPHCCVKPQKMGINYFFDSHVCVSI